MCIRKLLCLIGLAFIPLWLFSQRITFSEPSVHDGRDMNFDIIGKIKGNFWIYKKIKSASYITVYNNAMEIEEDIPLDFIPSKVFNVDFVTYPDSVYIFYQYHAKGKVYCMVARMDTKARKMGDPLELDNVDAGVSDETKIYTIINSDDKKYIMFFKMQKKQSGLILSSVLLNNNLQFLTKKNLVLPFNEQKIDYNNFLLDNDGNMFFSKTEKTASRNGISALWLYRLSRENTVADSLIRKAVPLKDRYIDGVILKLDNLNKACIISSFYYNAKRGNADGFFISTWDIMGDTLKKQVLIQPDNKVKEEALSEGNVKMALNNFFIKNIAVRKDGGFIVFAEEYYTKTNNNTWNRFDNYYPYMMSPYDYYSPYYYYPYYRPYGSYNGSQNTRYYYNNIIALSLTGELKEEWINIIPKSQYDNDDDNYLSYVQYNSGGEIHFLYNLQERQTLILADYIISPSGDINQGNTLRSQGMGYEFMPQFGKQIGAKQVIIPCTHHEMICFAKLEY